MKRRRFRKLSDYSTAPQNLHSSKQSGTKSEVIPLVLTILGIILLAFSNANLTGFVIANKTIDSAYPTAAGFILLIIALLLSLIKKTKNKELVSEIIHFF